MKSIEEVPFPYRNLFSEYKTFNEVQSQVFDDVYNSNKSIIVSAPTGSGKTVIFELAIIRLLQQVSYLNSSQNDFKMVYVAPIKALCSEKFLDWNSKFSQIGISCLEVTGDTDISDFGELSSARLIITTPEKWDSLTRKWKENVNIVTAVKLFMIDEVHLLNEDVRGPILEAIVSRMKTIQFSVKSVGNCGMDLRFIAASATIPNIRDMSEWIGGTDSEKIQFYQISEEKRPVKLEKYILGFNAPVASFKFDMSLNYKLPAIIRKYSGGKPTLIFCSSRKAVEMASAVLQKESGLFPLSDIHKSTLMQLSKRLKDVKLHCLIMKGIAYHHAGLTYEDRLTIENGFRSGLLLALVSTNTLAMGVNLPAHLVIIKSTEAFIRGQVIEYSESSLLQMIGRAGRPQYDVTGVAVIMTQQKYVKKYENLMNGCTPVESHLHKHLAEHLNSEIVLQTITDLDVAMEWIRSTFLYIRAVKSPMNYGFKAPGMTKEKVEKKLEEMVLIQINCLETNELITKEQTFGLSIRATQYGRLMARYYLSFDTMKIFRQIRGNESYLEMLNTIVRCKEFSEFTLRVNDKKILNNLNETPIRYPIKGKVKTSENKISCLIQANFDNIPIQDPSMVQDSVKMIRLGDRISKCLVEYIRLSEKRLRTHGIYKSLLTSVKIAKCFRAKLWENSIYVSKQLQKIGTVYSRLLVDAGKTTFKSILETEPRSLEMILNKPPPFGKEIHKAISLFPQYSLTMHRKDANSIELFVSQINQNFRPDGSNCTIVVGDSDNNLIFFADKINIMIQECGHFNTTFKIPDRNVDTIYANLVHETLVGVDESISITLNENKEHEKPKKKVSKRKTLTTLFNEPKKSRKSSIPSVSDINDSRQFLSSEYESLFQDNDAFSNISTQKALNNSNLQFAKPAPPKRTSLLNSQDMFPSLPSSIFPCNQRSSLFSQKNSDILTPSLRGKLFSYQYNGKPKIIHLKMAENFNCDSENTSNEPQNKQRDDIESLTQVFEDDFEEITVVNEDDDHIPSDIPNQSFEEECYGFDEFIEYGNDIVWNKPNMKNCNMSKILIKNPHVDPFVKSQLPLEHRGSVLSQNIILDIKDTANLDESYLRLPTFNKSNFDSRNSEIENNIVKNVDSHYRQNFNSGDSNNTCVKSFEKGNSNSKNLKDVENINPNFNRKFDSSNQVKPNLLNVLNYTKNRKHYESSKNIEKFTSPDFYKLQQENFNSQYSICLNSGDSNNKFVKSFEKSNADYQNVEDLENINPNLIGKFDSSKQDINSNRNMKSFKSNHLNTLENRAHFESSKNINHIQKKIKITPPDFSKFEEENCNAFDMTINNSSVLDLTIQSTSYSFTDQKPKTCEYFNQNPRQEIGAPIDLTKTFKNYNTAEMNHDLQYKCLKKNSSYDQDKAQISSFKQILNSPIVKRFKELSSELSDINMNQSHNQFHTLNEPLCFKRNDTTTSSDRFKLQPTKGSTDLNYSNHISNYELGNNSFNSNIYSNKRNHNNTETYNYGSIENSINMNHISFKSQKQPLCLNKSETITSGAYLKLQSNQGNYDSASSLGVPLEKIFDSGIDLCSTKTYSNKRNFYNNETYNLYDSTAKFKNIMLNEPILKKMKNNSNIINNSVSVNINESTNVSNNTQVTDLNQYAFKKNLVQQINEPLSLSNKSKNLDSENIQFSNQYRNNESMNLLNKSKINQNKNDQNYTQMNCTIFEPSRNWHNMNHQNISNTKKNSLEKSISTEKKNNRPYMSQNFIQLAIQKTNIKSLNKTDSNQNIKIISSTNLTNNINNKPNYLKRSIESPSLKRFHNSYGSTTLTKISQDKNYSIQNIEATLTSVNQNFEIDSLSKNQVNFENAINLKSNKYEKLRNSEYNSALQHNIDSNTFRDTNHVAKFDVKRKKLNRDVLKNEPFRNITDRNIYSDSLLKNDFNTIDSSQNLVDSSLQNRVLIETSNSKNKFNENVIHSNRNIFEPSQNFSNNNKFMKKNNVTTKHLGLTNRTKQPLSNNIAKPLNIFGPVNEATRKSFFENYGIKNGFMKASEILKVDNLDDGLVLPSLKIAKKTIQNDYSNSPHRPRVSQDNNIIKNMLNDSFEIDDAFFEIPNLGGNLKTVNKNSCDLPEYGSEKLPTEFDEIDNNTNQYFSDIKTSESFKLENFSSKKTIENSKMKPNSKLDKNISNIHNPDYPEQEEKDLKKYFIISKFDSLKIFERFVEGSVNKDMIIKIEMIEIEINEISSENSESKNFFSENLIIDNKISSLKTIYRLPDYPEKQNKTKNVVKILENPFVHKTKDSDICKLKKSNKNLFHEIFQGKERTAKQNICITDNQDLFLNPKKRSNPYRLKINLDKPKNFTIAKVDAKNHFSLMNEQNRQIALQKLQTKFDSDMNYDEERFGHDYISCLFSDEVPSRFDDMLSSQVQSSVAEEIEIKPDSEDEFDFRLDDSDSFDLKYSNDNYFTCSNNQKFEFDEDEEQNEIYESPEEEEFDFDFSGL